MTKYVRGKTVEVREENGHLWENLATGKYL